MSLHLAHPSPFTGVGCERPCYNEMMDADACAKAFPKEVSGYRGLNSGALIGKAKALIELYEGAKVWAVFLCLALQQWTVLCRCRQR